MSEFIEQNYGLPGDDSPRDTATPEDDPLNAATPEDAPVVPDSEAPGVFRPNARGRSKAAGMYGLISLARERTKDKRNDGVPFDGEEKRDWDN